jgi:hypothetical protein
VVLQTGILLNVQKRKVSFCSENIVSALKEKGKPKKV